MRFQSDRFIVFFCERDTIDSWAINPASTEYMPHLSRCPYCREYMNEPTREHLVPASYGGTCTIFICRACNQSRGNSLSDTYFLRFIRKDPELFKYHVTLSENSTLTKEVLNSLLDCDDDEIPSIEDFIKLQYQLEERSTGTRSARNSVHELVQQYVALHLSKNGTPLLGGRADKARRKAQRESKKRRKRREMREECNFVVKYVNGKKVISV